jgi:hypothetical protein
MTRREIMDRVDARVLPTANPCPSREEWDELRLESPARALGITIILAVFAIFWFAVGCLVGAA